MKRTGKVWTRIFQHPASKPTEVRMVKEKVHPNITRRVNLEELFLKLMKEEIAREALYKASVKLPIKTKFVKR